MELISWLALQFQLVVTMLYECVVHPFSYSRIEVVDDGDVEYIRVTRWTS